MKVRTLIMFNDLQSKTLRRTEEVFEVTAKRAEELTSAHNGTLVEVIEEDKTVKKVEPEKKSIPEKKSAPKKTTTKKTTTKKTQPKAGD